MKYLRCLLLVFLGWAVPLFAENGGTARLSVLFRMDNVVLRSDSIQEAIWDMFDAYHIPLTLACVPFRADNRPNFPLDPEFRRMIRHKAQRHMLELAVMGYGDVETNTERSPILFEGMPYDEQLEKVSKGRLLIAAAFGEPVGFFVPPMDAYDKKTLHALKAAGYTGISSDLSGVFAANGLAYLPHTLPVRNHWESFLQQKGSLNGVCVIPFSVSDLQNPAFNLDSLHSLLAHLSQKGYCCYTFSDYLEVSKPFPGSFRFVSNKVYRWYLQLFSNDSIDEGLFHEKKWGFQLIYLLFSIALSLGVVGLLVWLPVFIAKKR